MIDTEVESAMRSNSGRKKKNFQKEEGGRETRKEGGGGGRQKKKKPTLSSAQLFFLKRKSFESARLAPPRPALQPRAPPLSAWALGSVTSLIPPSSGFLLCCCVLSGRKAGSTFSFLQAGAEARAEHRCGFHLELLFLQTSAVPRTAYSLAESSSALGSPPQTWQGRRLEMWDAHSLQPRSFTFFF